MPESLTTARVCFAVDVEDLGPSDFVLVTGSTSSLGNWDPLKAKPLTKDADRPTRWRGFVDTTDDEVRFRYFIGYFLCGEQGERLIIGEDVSHSVTIVKFHTLNECRRRLK